MSATIGEALELLGKTTAERNAARASLEQLREAVEQALETYDTDRANVDLEPLREVLDELEA